MPLTLTLAPVEPDSALDDDETLAEDWQVLHREADRLADLLAVLWLALLRDVRRAVPRDDDLQDALSRGNRFGVESAAMVVWLRDVDQPFRQLALPLWQEAVARTSQALARRHVEVEPLTVTQPPIVQALTLALGQQAQQLTSQAQRVVQESVRDPAFQRATPAGQTRTLQDMLPLNRVQAESRRRLDARLREEGRPAAERRRAVRQASAEALQQRAARLAAHQAMVAVMQVQQIQWRQAEAMGMIGSRFRRYWSVTPDERLCNRCAPIPSMNPDGVGLDEPFSTPDGPTQSPPLHILCRCVVEGREP